MPRARPVHLRASTVNGKVLINAQEGPLWISVLTTKEDAQRFHEELGDVIKRMP